MVERLEKEAEEDATKKGFCDKELAESNEKKAFAKTSQLIVQTLTKTLPKRHLHRKEAFLKGPQGVHQ